jgi:hypothetical protein
MRWAKIRERSQDVSLSEQLHNARRLLRRTRIRCSVTVLLVLGSMSVSTVTIRNRFLQPRPAAVLASHCVSSLFAAGGNPVSIDSEEQTPSLAARFFQMTFLKRAGNREQSENPAMDTFEGFQAAAVAREQALLASNPDRIRELIKMVEKPRSVEELGNDLDAQIRQYLPSKDRAGLPDPAYMEYLCEMMAAISQLEWQLDRLAHGDDLNSYEKTLRRVVAVTVCGSPRIS